MPIASCHFVIARPLGNLHTAREQVATHHQPRNRDIALPSLTSARLVVGTAGSRFPNRDIALASLTSASLVVGTAGVDSPNRDIALASLTSASVVVGTAGGRFSTGGIP
jgi:ethanolamine ammonia-lyase small subunit